MKKNLVFYILSLLIFVGYCQAAKNLYFWLMGGSTVLDSAFLLIVAALVLPLTLLTARWVVKSLSGLAP